jgi:hypothetical protein
MIHARHIRERRLRAHWMAHGNGRHPAAFAIMRGVLARVTCAIDDAENGAGAARESPRVTACF